MSEPRVVIVTGAAGGIGRATVEHLAAKGDAVLCVDRDTAGLAAVGEQVRRAGGRAEALTIDLSDPGAASAVVEHCLRRWGRLDVLALVAGIGQYGHTAEVTVAEWDRVLDVNLRAPFLLTQGAVVAVSSIAGIQGWPYSAVYSASKGGLVTMMRSLAIEYGPAGVRINVACPGGVDTGLAAGFRTTDHTYDETLRKRSTSLTGRKAEPGEIATLIAFLVAAEASFVSGAVLRADGGAFA
jgi:NAD(P)-dependent dehydrogenase (short-subunit alcohol dehydrogenase family)